MRIVPFWARAHASEDGSPDPRGVVTAVGWSSESQEAANTHAQERAARQAKLLRENAPLRRVSEYYPDGERPMREPIVEEIAPAGVLAGLITRNAYGSYVLNTSSVMFIDIDLPFQAPPAQPGFFSRLFGAKAEPGPTQTEREAPILRQIDDAMKRHPDVGMHLYRTHSGFRGLVTSTVDGPTTSSALKLMNDLGSDPLYVRLCKIQECFRARVSPKPWRIGVPSAPRSYYPWHGDPRRKRGFDDWDAQYEKVRHSFSVCEEVKHFGPTAMHAEVKPIFDLHERWTCGSGGLA